MGRQPKLEKMILLAVPYPLLMSSDAYKIHHSINTIKGKKEIANNRERK